MKLDKNNLSRIVFVFLALTILILGTYLIIKYIKHKVEGFAVTPGGKYILKDTTQNDTITFAQNNIVYYSSNYSAEPPTPVTLNPVPGLPLTYNVDTGNITAFYPRIGTSNQQNLISNFKYTDNGNNTGVLEYKDQRDGQYYYMSVSITPYVEPTTTTMATTTTTPTTTMATTTTTTTPTTTLATTTTTPTTTIPTTTKAAFNVMLDSVQGEIDKSNDMLQTPRYTFIDNQQRLDKLTQRVNTLMNNLQLNKNISMTEKKSDVTFY